MPPAWVATAGRSYCLAAFLMLCTEVYRLPPSSIGTLPSVARKHLGHRNYSCKEKLCKRRPWCVAPQSEGARTTPLLEIYDRTALFQTPGSKTLSRFAKPVERALDPGVSFVFIGQVFRPSLPEALERPKKSIQFCCASDSACKHSSRTHPSSPETQAKPLDSPST